MKITTFKINPLTVDGQNERFPQWFLSLRFFRKNVQINVIMSTPRINYEKYWVLLPTIAFQKEYSYPGMPLKAWHIDINWLNMTLFRLAYLSGYKPDKDPDSDQ